MPYAVNHTRFGLALQRLLGLQGAVMPQLVEDVFPTVGLESEGPELDALRGWRRFHAGGATAASVANFGQAICNPPIDTICVIETLAISSQAGGHFIIGSRRTGGSTPSGYALDVRQEPGTADPIQAATAAAPGLTVTTVAASAIAANGFRILITNLGSILIPLNMVIGFSRAGPGAAGNNWSLVVETAAVNTDIAIGLIGRSRPITDLERQV